MKQIIELRRTIQGTEKNRALYTTGCRFLTGTLVNPGTPVKNLAPWPDKNDILIEPLAKV